MGEMMDVNTLEGAQLDEAVFRADGLIFTRNAIIKMAVFGKGKPVFSVSNNIPPYSTSWEHGGPLIDRERISVQASQAGDWRAFLGDGTTNAGTGRSAREPLIQARGNTALVAAMRAFVASKGTT